MQGPVQGGSAPGSLPGGAEDLDLLGLHPHVLGEALPAQLHHQLHCCLGVPAAEEKEVAVAEILEGRQAAAVYRVGRPDNGTGLCLPENLCQGHHGDTSAADEIGKYISRPHRGQLIRVAYHDEAAVGPQGREQGVH